MITRNKIQSVTYRLLLAAALLAGMLMTGVIPSQAATPAIAQTAPRYSITELQGLPQRINDNGQIAGWIYVGADAHAAIYSNGAWRDLGVPAGDQLSAFFGINNAGAAVGYSFVALPPPSPPCSPIPYYCPTDFRWQAIWASAGATSVETLSALAPDSFAYAINDSDVIVGCLNRYDDVFPDPHRAFLYVNGNVTDLHSLLATNPLLDFTCARDVNNTGIVVGEIQPTSAPQRGFLYWNGSVRLLAQSSVAYLSNAKAVSNADKIVGEGRLAGFTANHALVYDVATGAISSLGVESTGAYNSRPNDINSHGDVVGMMFLGVGEHAFLASGGQVYDLNDLIPAGSDWVLQEAFSINDSGLIVGRGYRTSSPSVARYFLMQPENTAEGLIDTVKALVTQGALNGGQGNALISKLEAAIQQLDRGNVATAIHQLEAFVNQVNALIGGGVLPSAQGQPLLDAADAIIAALGG